MAPEPSKLRIAVLVVPPVQLLDLSPIDLLFMLSKSYLRDCKLPGPLIDRGLDEVEILYVAEEASCTSIVTSTSTSAAAADDGIQSDKNNKTTNEVDSQTTYHFAELTANASIRITHTLSSTQLAPGTLDIILVPGPDPSTTISAAIKTFLRRHAEVSSTHILSICTGIFVLGQAGLLDDKPCTGPRPLISMRLVKEFPRAKWSDTNRWEVDDSGRLWTAGGITNGQEMVAAYIRHRFSDELADLVCVMADVGEKNRRYDKGQAREGLGFVWILMRSLFRGWTGAASEKKKTS